MIVGSHSTKLPQSWDTGSDQPSVPASSISVLSIFCNGTWLTQEPPCRYSNNLFDIWNYRWSFTISSAASVVGCIVNFFVSYLICMFQDSVPAGSYNDPFLSSVIPMVTPTWCHRAN